MRETFVLCGREMKITVGIRGLDEAEYYLRNGAAEISFGVPELPSFCGGQSLRGAALRDIAETVSMAHSLGRRVYVYCNDTVADCRPAALRIKELRDAAGIDGFIIAGTDIIDCYPDSSDPPVWHMQTGGGYFRETPGRFVCHYPRQRAAGR